MVQKLKKTKSKGRDTKLKIFLIQSGLWSTSITSHSEHTNVKIINKAPHTTDMPKGNKFDYKESKKKTEQTFS